MSAGQVPILMVIYGAGFASVFVLLSLMYAYAYRSRGALGLSPLQIFETRASIVVYATTAAVGMVSAGIAVLLPAGSAGLAGFAYFLMAVPATVAGTLVGRRRRLEARRHPG